jgi:hypothetical protein
MLNFLFQTMPANDTFKMTDAFGMALFFVVVGYEFLLFCYFFFSRFRKSKKMYWLYFSLFFLLIAISRVFYIIYDFVMPIFYNFVNADPLFPIPFYRIASLTGWLACATLVGLLCTLLFTNDTKMHKIIRVVAPLIVVGIGSLWVILPTKFIIDPGYFVYASVSDGGYGVDPGIEPVLGLFGKSVGLFYLNYITLPLLNFLLPLIFLFLSVKSIGVIRRSSALNFLGFLVYYTGRTLQPLFEPLGFTVLTQAVWPPLIILMGLLILAWGNLSLPN